MKGLYVCVCVFGCVTTVSGFYMYMHVQWNPS